MPDARCTRGLVCNGKRKHTSIQVQRRTSDIPCAMVLTVSFVLSPEISGFLASVAFGYGTSAPGRADTPPKT